MIIVHFGEKTFQAIDCTGPTSGQ